MTSPSPLCLVALVSLAACASTAGGTRTDGGADVAAEATLPATFDLAITVRDNFQQPVEGARVRVDDARGASREVATDAQGRAPLVVQREDGPWAVTAVLAGYTVASEIDACGPLTQPLLLDRTMFALPPDRPATVTVSGSIRGTTDVAPPDRNVFIVARTGVTGNTLSATYATRVPVRDGTPLRLLFVESQSDRLTNYVLTPAVPFPTAPLTLDVAMPRPPAPLLPGRVTLRWPTEGIALRDEVGDTASVTLRRSYALHADDFPYGFTAPYRAPVARRVDAASIDFVMLPPPFAPSDVSVDVRRARADAVSVRATLPITAGTAAVDVPPVRAMELSGASLDALVWRADADAYPLVSVEVYDAQSRRVWVVASRCARRAPVQRLPLLPAGVTLANLGLGGGTGGVVLGAVHWRGERRNLPDGWFEQSSVYLARYVPGVAMEGR